MLLCVDFLSQCCRVGSTALSSDGVCVCVCVSWELQIPLYLLVPQVIVMSAELRLMFFVHMFFVFCFVCLAVAVAETVIPEDLSVICGFPSADDGLQEMA